MFEATHALVLELVAQGKVHGLRIDHPDGLYDPRSTSSACRQRYGRAGAQPSADEQAGAQRPLYLVVEKILAGHERLPERLAGARHHRLRLRQPGQRPVRRRRGARRAWSASTAASPARQIDFDDLVYRAKQTDHAHDAWPASSTCWPTSSTASRSADRHTPRLHAQQPARRAGRGRRLLPGLPHLRHGARRLRTTTGATSTGRSARRASAARPPRPASSTSCARCCCCESGRGQEPRVPRGSAARFAMKFQQLTAR